jgi:hypothetical protein
MELRDYDPLGTVDHERPERRENGELPEIDFLLDDILGALDPVLQSLVDHETQRRLERRRVRHVPLDAFLDGVLRVAEGEVHELERVIPVHIGDREHLLEHPFQGDIRALRVLFRP